ncbi:MAG: SPOR domain-containing protein [Deltaproteobacteria bacterium]|jgi:hypothetical protein|nr:SPOR domain-containing protein [Deltaproteobacteria bacterium]
MIQATSETRAEPARTNGRSRAKPRAVGALAAILAAAALAAAACLALPSCGGKPTVEERAAGADPNAPPASLMVQGTQMREGVAPLDQKGSGDFNTAWVASYLDEAPAKRAVEAFQGQGLTAFSVRKTLGERTMLSFRPVGDFHLVMVGLFADQRDASDLGKRLVAKGLVSQWQVTPSDDPGELAGFRRQIEPVEERSARVTSSAQERAGRPLSPQSPVVTGEGFRRVVHGRFVRSYRDPLAAKQEARRLTASGWPASVQSAREGGGMWYRVYLVESKGDPMDLKPNPRELEQAQASARRQAGFVLLLDTSGLKGTWGTVGPDPSRKDASSCAGYSQAGRMLTSVERLVGYIPDAGQLMVVKTLTYNEPSSILERVTRPVRNWWEKDDSSLADVKPAYGPSIYDRTSVLRAIRAAKVDTKPAPLAPELQNFNQLGSIPGKKTVVLFSDFRDSSGAEKAQGALGSIKGQYGGDLDFIVVYGDTDDKGYKLAQSLARSGGGGDAYDGCRLLADNAYFEGFVKRVFRR